MSEEAFEEWVNSKDPEEQEGKGVCITSVQSFMRWLKEADEEGWTSNDMPLLSPQFFLNGVNRNQGFVADRQNILWRDLKWRNGAKHFEICDFTTATSVLSLARKADLFKAFYILLEWRVLKLVVYWPSVSHTEGHTACQTLCTCKSKPLTCLCCLFLFLIYFLCKKCTWRVTMFSGSADGFVIFARVRIGCILLLLCYSIVKWELHSLHFQDIEWLYRKIYAFRYLKSSVTCLQLGSS